MGYQVDSRLRRLGMRRAAYGVPRAHAGVASRIRAHRTASSDAAVPEALPSQCLRARRFARRTCARLRIIVALVRCVRQLRMSNSVRSGVWVIVQ